MSELQSYTGLLDVRTGELLEPTVSNAARVLNAARAMDAQIRELKREATAWLVEESARRGTKTLHEENETVTLTGGTSVEYDAADLIALLTDAGCPPDRINAAVTTEITYKVNRSVLNQLASANKDYAAAIRLCETEVEKPYRASVALRRNKDEQ